MEQPNNPQSQASRTRRQTYIIPKRSIAQRYPLTTFWGCTISALLVFFSRPLYDAFIREPEIHEIPVGERRAAIIKAWRI